MTFGEKLQVLLAAGGIGTIFYHPILRLWEKYGKRGE